MAAKVAGRFVLVPLPPRLAEYQQLRSAAGLPALTDDNAVVALRECWSVCHIRAPGGGVVAMGRVIADGRRFFRIDDVVSHPEFRRRGLGGEVLAWLLEQITVRSGVDSFVTLIADPPTRSFFEQAGFRVMGQDGEDVHLMWEP